jgi:3-methyladenine DNA glycosylase AlkD
MPMSGYTNALISVFSDAQDANKAIAQERYMKNKFPFFGISSPDRKRLQAPFLVKKYLPTKKEAYAIAEELWQKPQRELHYFSMELIQKYKTQMEVDDIIFFEWLLTHNSWWDTVDLIASNLVGYYFIKYPEMRDKTIEKWLRSDHIWLQRTCLIFQLKYRDKTDVLMLSNCIEYLIGTKEFFINKAIGWALRQFSRENPIWVEEFVEQHPNMSQLSKREALRLI